MDRTTTLLVMDLATPDAMISDLAESAAQDQTHLSCLLIAKSPVLPISAYGATPYGGMNVPDNWSELISEAHEEEANRVQEIETLLARSQVSGDAQSAHCATFDVKHIVARRARVSDIAHLADNLRDTPDIHREAAHGILFHSPAGLMLNASPSKKPARVFVAWDSSESASRAVHAALPYLKAAEEVIIGCFDPVMTEERDGADPGVDVATWLSHHGCNVTVSQYPSGGLEVGQCIQDRAKEVGAELLVAGAYGHARMFQAMFGGTTRMMMAQTELPLLLAH